MSMDEPLTKLPHFDWDKAKAFYYVVKAGNQIEAAKFLGCSQPNLSRQITILEDELNCRLLVRTRQGTRLTRKGEQFFKIIERAFLDLKGFTYNNAVVSEDGEKRKIKISVTHAVAVYLLKEHLISYNILHPEIIFEIITEEHHIDLAVNDVDLVIRPFDRNAKSVIQVPLFKYEKKLFASPKYLEKYGEPSSVEDLRNHQVLAHSQPEKHPYSDLKWILEVGMPNGQKRKPVFMSNSLEYLVEAAQQGLGIMGGYREMSIIRNSTLKVVLPDLPGPQIDGHLIYPEYLAQDKVFQGLIDFLVSRT